MPSLKKQAKRLAKKGRKGDSQLLHLSRDELMSLMGTGRITRNPRTGLPEAFNLSDYDPGLSLATSGTGSPYALPNVFSGTNAGPTDPNTGQTSMQYGPYTSSMGGFMGSGLDWKDDIAPGIRFVGTALAGAALGNLGGEVGEAGSIPADASLFGETPGAGANVGATAGASAFPSFDPSIDSSPAATSDGGMTGFPGDSGFPSLSNPDLGSFPPGGGEGMGMPGETTTTGESVPGDPGGDPWYKRLSRMGEYLPSMKQAAGGLQIGMGAFGLYNAYQGRQAQKAQQKQQQSYYDQLNDLMAHPERVTSLPGYQFNLGQGNQALARRMASMGYGTSGNLALATQRYGQDYASAALGQQEQLLASQYGRASPPTATMPDPTQLAMRSLSNLGYGMSGF
jgi:hypothetical protein